MLRRQGQTDDATLRQTGTPSPRRPANFAVVPSPAADTSAERHLLASQPTTAWTAPSHQGHSTGELPREAPSTGTQPRLWGRGQAAGALPCDTAPRAATVTTTAPCSIGATAKTRHTTQAASETPLHRMMRPHVPAGSVPPESRHAPAQPAPSAEMGLISVEMLRTPLELSARRWTQGGKEVPALHPSMLSFPPDAPRESRSPHKPASVAVHARSMQLQRQEAQAPIHSLSAADLAHARPKDSWQAGSSISCEPIAPAWLAAARQAPGARVAFEHV